MFVMMGIGYVLCRIKMIDTVGVAQMSDFVLYIASPAVVLLSFETDFSVDKLVGAAWCAGIYAAITGISIALVNIGMRHCLPASKFAVIFTNCGFIGIPLVQHVLGTESVFYSSVCIAVSTFIVWTYGVWLYTRDKDEISLRKVFVNPAIISLFVGAALFIFGIRLPPVLQTTAQSLGDVNAGLAMTILGSYLAQSDIRDLLHGHEPYLVSFVRLVVVPLITIGVLLLVPWVDQNVRLVLLITLSTPSAGMTAMFAQKYGGRYGYAAGLIAFTTALSVVSMPIMMAIGLAVM